ncbi:hypothetical protein [Streptomyces sp. R35]|uniref:Uncharacterized protein n=1 Tax=Streptomyces sp. R35 TaxID=3238630 RepID=A0AB39SIQ3_9ACTN
MDALSLEEWLAALVARWDDDTVEYVARGALGFDEDFVAYPMSWHLAATINGALGKGCEELHRKLDGLHGVSGTERQVGMQEVISHGIGCTACDRAVRHTEEHLSLRSREVVRRLVLLAEKRARTLGRVEELPEESALREWLAALLARWDDDTVKYLARGLGEEGFIARSMSWDLAAAINGSLELGCERVQTILGELEVLVLSGTERDARMQDAVSHAIGCVACDSAVRYTEKHLSQGVMPQLVLLAEKRARSLDQLQELLEEDPR